MSNVKIQLQHYITMSSLFYPPGMKWSVWAPGRVVAVAVGRRGCTWDGREARTPCMPETGPLWWAGDTSLGLPHSSHCLFTHRHVNINACSHSDTSHQYRYTHTHHNSNNACTQRHHCSISDNSLNTETHHNNINKCGNVLVYETHHSKKNSESAHARTHVYSLTHSLTHTLSLLSLIHISEPTRPP